MKKRLLTLGAAALLLCAGAAPALAVHDFTGQCETCHLSDPGTSPLLFTASIETLCRECHTQPSDYEHPQNVNPADAGITIPSGFWLDAGGNLNCATCHDPHQTVAEEKPFLLRSAAVGTDFCHLCHAETVTAEKRHLAAVYIAHSKSTPAPPGSDDTEIDALSTTCASCHDGSGGAMAVFCVLGQPGQCSSHVIGLDYQNAAAASESNLNPPSALSPLLVFTEGKVGCLSCHNIYSQQTTQLAVNNGGSALCSQCHRK